MKDIGVLLELYNFRDTLVMKVMIQLPLYVAIHGFHTVHKRGCREVHIHRSAGATQHTQQLVICYHCLWCCGSSSTKGMKRCQAHEELGSSKLRIHRIAADVRHIHRTYDCRRSRTELWKKKVTVAVILAGCTSKIQPLGVRINKDFKKTSSRWATSNGQCPARARRMHQTSLKGRSQQDGKIQQASEVSGFQDAVSVQHIQCNGQLTE